MNLKTLFSGVLLAGTLCAAAQTLTPNIRMIPGGLEIIDRENASTPAFDTRQKLKPTDQRLVISFMEIQGENIQRNNFTNRDFRQTASLKLGKDGSNFNLSASAVRKNENTVDLTFSVKRNTPADIGQKPFFSLTFTRALLGIPFQLNMLDPAGKSWRHTLVYSKEKQSGWLWSSHGEHRVHGIKIPMNHGELTITGFTAPAMACKYNIGTGNLRLYMGGKEFGGIEATLSVSYKPYPAETLNLRPSANMGFQDDTADDATGGWTDQGPENDLRMMTAGKRMFLNMTFDVIDPKTNNGKSVLALGCPERAFLPKQAVVPVGGKRFRYLYFLHADAWPKKKEVGTILVKYTDGTEQKISVKDGTDVINWWAPQSRPNAIVAWQGQNRYEILGLAMSRFAVQNKPVDSLTLTSSGNSVWLIVAITGSSADFIPFPSVDAEAVETPVTMDSRDWMEYTFTVARKTPVKGSALDFSGLLDAPAGKYGFVQCKGENFVFEKRPDIPVRFNGTNLSGEISTHFTHRESDALADQLAALGLNAARLHHFDEWLVDHTKTDGSVDPKRLDNLHYLFSALKKRGIYVTIDLFTMRTSGFPVKLKGMFDAKTRLLFSKELRANLMNFARTMLTPVNPYTGLALKDDPALITVGLINEDPIISGGHDELAYPNKNPVQHQAIKAVFEAWGKKHGVAIPEKPGHELYIRVMNEHHIDIYREMTEELRKMGVRQPTSDMSVSAMSICAIPRKEYDYVDNHYYFSHPRNLGHQSGWPCSYSDKSMTGVLFDNMTCYLSTRIKGKPFTVTEYNFCAPNRFRHEGGLAMGAYSAFQNVSGIYSFDFNGYNHKTRWNFVTQPGGHLGWFAISVDPVRLLSQRVISLLYLRGDVAAAPESETKLLTVTPADYKLKEVQEYGYPRTAAKARIPAKFHTLALYTRVAMDAAERVPANSWSLAEMLSEKPLKKFPAGKGTYLPEKGYISSSTGEITVDANISTIRVVTPKSEGFTVTGKSMKGSRLSVTGSTGICSVFASALDGKNLAETSRAIVFHITDIQASGRKITRLGDRQLAYNWGKQNPYLLKKSSATVSLHNTGKGRLRIHALDINGKILAEVPFKEENNVVTFTADTGKYASMAYELVREP